MVTDIFGEMLFTPPSGECLKEFPSPAFLKKRIMISTKPPKEYKAATDDDLVKKGRDLGDKEVWGREVPSFIRRDRSVDKVCVITHLLHLVSSVFMCFFFRPCFRMIQTEMMMMMMTMTMMMMMVMIRLRRMHHRNISI